MAALVCLIAIADAVAMPIEAFEPRPLWQAGDEPRRRYYRRVAEVDGRVRGRSYSRRPARFALWSLDDGVVVRLQERRRRSVLLERRFGPFGDPLTTHRPAAPWPSIVVHHVPNREIGLSGWADQQAVGATLHLPVAPLSRDDGGVAAWVLGGELTVWHDPQPVDVASADYWRGLLAGCGCDLVDRVADWVDGRPAVRFRLARGSDQQDLWAVPLSESRDAATGTWYASYRAPRVTEDTASVRLAPGFALVALARLDRLGELSEGDP